MILQGPAPPVPPSPPSFDPNLIWMNDGGPPVLLLIVIAALTASVIILWPIMKAFGRRLEGKGNTDAALKADVDHIHTRLYDVDALQMRVQELEDRLDFAERLLAQVQQPSRLGAPTEEGRR